MFVLDTQTVSIGDEQLQEPTHEDKCVQVYIKHKHVRSKYTQTEKISQNIGTSPSKTLTAAVSTSPFKVEEHVKPVRPTICNVNRPLMVRSDSDVSLSSKCSSLNEEEAKIEKETETKQALLNTIKKIEAKPRLYIGIPKDCYFLINLIHTNTGIPTEHILLCIKKIRLNTTFEELSDQFGISPSYAGKIFLKKYSNNF